VVDSVIGHNILSLLDAYSRYNQIFRVEDNRLKTACIIEDVNYHNEIMPFSLKIVGATYQSLMDKVFNHLIRKNIEVDMDNMVVKLPTQA